MTEKTFSNPSKKSYPEFQITFGVAFVVLFLSGLWFWTAVDREDIEQPIAFNHLLHTENGLECTDCHTGVLESASAGFPSNDVCMMCHMDPLGESVEEERLLEYLTRDEPIPWKSLFEQPAHVFYSHRRHVVSAELECSTCHADMGEREKPPTAPPFKLTMDVCMDCHSLAGVRNDCTVCHR